MEIDIELEHAVLALLRVDCYLRSKQLAELAISASDYSGLRSNYRETIYVAVLSYLVQTGVASTSFKGEVKRAIVEAFPDTFYAGYGESKVEADDDTWLTAKISAD